LTVCKNRLTNECAFGEAGQKVALVGADGGLVKHLASFLWPLAPVMRDCSLPVNVRLVP
jgi:hypothetical protein